MQLVDEALAAVSEEIKKAAETIATYTFSPQSRSIFSPENLDERIMLVVPTTTPLRNRLPRVQGKGEATGWKTLTSKLHTNAAGGGTNTSIFFADAGAPSETSQTYTQQAQAYKLLGRKLEVGGLAAAASRGRDGQPDMVESRLNTKIAEVKLGEEEALIGGDSSVTNQFDGLYKQITTNSGNMTFLTVSGINTEIVNKLAPNGAEDPTLLLATGRQLQALVDDLGKSGAVTQVLYTMGENPSVKAGQRVEGIINSITGSVLDVRYSRFTGNAALLLTEKTPTGEVAIDVSELLPMSRVDRASQNFSEIAFVVEAEAVRVWAEIWQEEITVGTGAL